MEIFTEVNRQYADFATYNTTDSPCFADWAAGVVADPEVAAWIATLPPIKQQPNLVFAAARWHGVPAPGAYAGLRDALLGDDASGGAIRATILARATQTNEVGRLATLVPAFARLAGGGPIALLEVGASAGLNLFPDRWSYAWTTESGVVRAGPAAGPGAGPLTCEVAGPAPLPEASPTVAWRGGIDLNPLDVTDADEMDWLITLVWPEQDDRRARLVEAIAVARADPPQLVAGDLLDELPALVVQAAAYAPVVVFHSAVIAYLEPDDRERFHVLMDDLVAAGACHWVSNEGPRVLPRVTATSPVEAPAGRFVLGVDGRTVAHTHGHGRSMRWL